MDFVTLRKLAAQIGRHHTAVRADLRRRGYEICAPRRIRRDVPHAVRLDRTSCRVLARRHRRDHRHVGLALPPLSHFRLADRRVLRRLPWRPLRLSIRRLITACVIAAVGGESPR